MITTRVLGDRQAGKTEMLLAFAEKLCREGQRVLYVSHDWKLARNDFMRVAQSVQFIPGFRAYRTNGNERVTHESGGELKFISAGSEARGFIADTLFVDDVHDYYHPGAGHVIRASL